MPLRACPLLTTTDDPDCSSRAPDRDTCDLLTLLRRVGVTDLIPTLQLRGDANIADAREALVTTLRDGPRALIERRGRTVRWWVEEVLGSLGEPRPRPRACRLTDGSLAVLHDRLGKGGFGSLWDAEVERVGRAAVKVSSGDPLADVHLREEADVLAELRVVGVPRLLGRGETGEGPFLVEELLEGSPLRSLHSLGTPGPAPALAEAWTGTAETLASLHAHGIAHGDVTPDNVLVGTPWGSGQAPRAWLVDFGLATRDGNDADGSLVEATRGYADPRVLAGGPRDRAADVYALGAIAWEGYARSPFRRMTDWQRLREAIDAGRWRGVRAAEDAARRERRTTQETLPVRDCRFERVIAALLAPMCDRPSANQAVEMLRALLPE